MHYKRERGVWAEDVLEPGRPHYLLFEQDQQLHGGVKPKVLSDGGPRPPYNLELLAVCVPGAIQHRRGHDQGASRRMFRFRESCVIKIIISDI